MKPIRLMLVDDHALFRRGLASLLDHLEDVNVVGEASDGREAVERARELAPDLILMDVQMPGTGGLEATRMIHDEMPHVGIVMLSISDDDGDLFEAIKSGARGYLLKNMSPEDLFEMLRGVSRGEAPMSGQTAARILDEFARLASKESQASTSGSPLTSREKEVLQLVAQGKTNREIGARLFITEYTVKNHLRSILSKLHVHSRVQAATYALREGLIEDPSSDS